MQQAKPSARSLQRARVSWEQAQEDLKIAHECWKSAPEKSALQSSQAALNALSSVLETQGFFQLPAYSAVELLDHTVTVASELEAIRSACYVLDGTLERDIFGHTRKKGIKFTPPFAKACAEASAQVLEAVAAYWHSHQADFAALSTSENA